MLLAQFNFLVKIKSISGQLECCWPNSRPMLWMLLQNTRLTHAFGVCIILPTMCHPCPVGYCSRLFYTCSISCGCAANATAQGPRLTKSPIFTDLQCTHPLFQKYYCRCLLNWPCALPSSSIANSISRIPELQSDE